ncbi:MAG TPA: hypothetical protein VD816_12380 [Ohtaekwangia sp.]|nr:hypothetical protein [Ohtaekwangia sp.]
MMKKICLFLSLFSFSLLISCSKDDDAKPGKVAVTDPASLSAALVIEGAERKSGDIPYPSNGGGQYGQDLDIQTTTVIVTPNSDFDFVAQTASEEGYIFIKINGTDEYFQIPIADITAGRRQLSAIDLSVRLNAKPFQESFDAPATVQTFTMPLQGQTADFTNLNFWSPPKQVTFKAVATGTGKVTITLTWDKDDSDVDLWLIEPDGNQIDYTNTISETGGYLDYDNTIGFGPENIFYDDASSPLSGQYQVKVHYYSNDGAGAVNYNVVVQNGSDIKTFKGTLTAEDEEDAVTTFNR